jgi:hypothetical protein
MTPSPQAEAEVMGDLIDIEGQEAELVFQAKSQGLPAEHRADISPIALLGLRLIAAPPPGQGGATSWPGKPIHMPDARSNSPLPYRGRSVQ